MKNNLYRTFIFLSALVVFYPSNGHGRSQENSHDFISKCLGNIRPVEESAIRPIFDQVINKVNPTVTEGNITLLKKWLNSKHAYIQLVDKAIEKSHIKFPLIDVSKDVSLMELPSFTEFKSLIALKLIEAKIQIHEGYHEDAVETILDVVKIGNMVRHGEQSTILNYMIGTALERTGIRWLQDLLCTIKYDNRTLEMVLTVINVSKTSDDAFITAIESEFNNFIIPSIIIYSNKIEAILSQMKIDQASIYDRNDSIKITKIQYQRIIDNAKVPWPKRNKKKSSDSNNDLDILTPEAEYIMELVSCDMLNEFDIKNSEHVAKWQELELAAENKQNFLGRLLNSSSSSFDSYYQRSVKLRTKRNITRTFVALSIFNNNYGHFPKELNKLIEAEIIKEIPLDLFSNRPLNFSTSDSKIWSIGNDEKNNMGDQKNDIVFSYALTEKSQNSKPCN